MEDNNEKIEEKRSADGYSPWNTFLRQGDNHPENHNCLEDRALARAGRWIGDGPGKQPVVDRGLLVHL